MGTRCCGHVGMSLWDACPGQRWKISQSSSNPFGEHICCLPFLDGVIHAISRRFFIFRGWNEAIGKTIFEAKVWQGSVISPWTRIMCMNNKKTVWIKYKWLNVPGGRGLGLPWRRFIFFLGNARLQYEIRPQGCLECNIGLSRKKNNNQIYSVIFSLYLCVGNTIIHWNNL